MRMRRALIVVTCIVLGCIVGVAQEKPFSGMVLRLASMADQFAPFLVELGRRFETLTGARVEVDILGYPELFAAVTHDLATGTKVYDLITVDIVWTGLFAEREWMVDLEPLIKRDYLELDIPDILPVCWSQGRWKVGDKWVQIAFPMAAYANSLIYRKDLFEDPAEKEAFYKRYGYELRPPRSIKELRDIAEFFTRPPHLYGLVANGARGPAVAQDWMEFMRIFGGDIIRDGKVVVYSPENLAALEFFVELHTKWAPPGSVGYWWDDRETAYRTGLAVMQSSWSIARPGYEDPKISLVVGKTGMAIPPFEPSTIVRTGFGGWGIGINNDIDPERQEAAWAFIKWITSAEIQKEWARHEGAPIRLSVLTDPELVREMPWYPTLLKILIHGDGDYRPRYPEYSEIQDILGLRVHQAITLELTPDEALRLAHQEIEALFAGK